jgi:UDPglucose 6-dehydrogenase
MKIGIVGYGHVGKAMYELFKNAIIYDINGIGSKEEINQCDVVFVCVPTPSKNDGRCDTSIVEDVISWVQIGRAHV